MQYRKLGNTDLDVSLLGLGTMTWGHQNSAADAHRQLDAALAAGVNLVDTAEMYPTPTHADTWGSTERYIGTWLEKSGRSCRQNWALPRRNWPWRTSRAGHLSAAC